MKNQFRFHVTCAGEIWDFEFVEEAIDFARSEYPIKGETILYVDVEVVDGRFRQVIIGEWGN